MSDLRIAQAQRLSGKAHEHQERSDGTQYSFHIQAVVSLVRGYGHNHVIVAWLHDVVEDTEVTLKDLINEGFDIAVINAVEAITKRDGEGYASFILRCSQNSIARTVKMADLTHNLSDHPENQRKQKYEMALMFLQGTFK